MTTVAPKFGVLHLTRENVFDISKSTLERIRDQAFYDVSEEIQSSENDIEIISTPAVFRVEPWGDYLTGRVDGISLNHIEKISPTSIVVFIDDLLRVWELMKTDSLRKGMKLSIKDLAEWRQSAIEIVKEYVNLVFSKTDVPLPWIVFAREHPIDTFVDLLLMEKPILYLSFHITGEKDFSDIHRFLSKLRSSFVCLDPYTIKDWDIVTAYDKAIEHATEDKVTISVRYTDGEHTFRDIPLSEIENAIDLIRTQIVMRDFDLISNAHATVVYHKDSKPSYGVMSEIIHSGTRVNKPVYVLYPFKIRPSPFFEQYVQRDKLLYGEDAEKLENQMLERLKQDCRKWTTISPATLT